MSEDKILPSFKNLLLEPGFCGPGAGDGDRYGFIDTFKYVYCRINEKR